MAGKDSKHLAEFRKSLEGWTDHRFASGDELLALGKFNMYLVNLAELDGWQYDGHSFTVGTPMSRLVVRGTVDGIPHVVFSSGRTSTGCITAFLRKMEEGWLEWQVDRFRT